MATKNKSLTLKKGTGRKHLKPYCEKAKTAADLKTELEVLRPLAAEELKAKLDADPETKDFTGTVVCIYNDTMYKIRVQRPTSCDWRSKNIDDPDLRQYQALMDEIDEKKATASELEATLAKAHPECLERGFVIGFLGNCPPPPLPKKKADKKKEPKKN